MHVVIGNVVRGDLRLISVYYSKKQQPDVAAAIRDDLISATRSLTENQFGRRLSLDLPPNFRRMLVDKYVIYYDIDEPVGVVYIIGVRHGRRKPLSAATFRRRSRDARQHNFDLPPTKTNGSGSLVAYGAVSTAFRTILLSSSRRTGSLAR